MPRARQHDVYTGLDLLKMKEDPNEWIVPDMIPRAGKTLIFGQGASYKSAIAFDLAIAVASGRFLFSQFTVKLQGPVLINSTEGSIFKNRRRIVSHARAHDVNLAELPFYFCQQPFYMDDQLDVDELEEWLKLLKPILVVLDPLDSCFAGEENSARDTKPVRREVDRLVEKYQTSFIIIHHQAKNTKSGASPRGSSAWYDWADAVLHVEKSQLKVPGLSEETRLPLMTVKSQKQRDGEEGPVFSGVPNIDNMMGKITFSFHNGKDYTGIINTYLKRKIYKALRESATPMLNNMVAEAIGVRPDRVSTPLAELEAEGLASRSGVVGRPMGPKGTRTKPINAWVPLIKRAVVDDATTMLRLVEKMPEILGEKYAFNPDGGAPEIEVGEPNYEAGDSNEETGDSNVDPGNMDSIRTAGDEEGSRVLKLCP